MAEPQAHETLGQLLQVITDDTLYHERAKNIADREAALQAKTEELSAMAKQNADDAKKAAEDRAEAERLHAEMTGDLAKRIEETNLAYRFQIERDANLKERETALATAQEKLLADQQELAGKMKEAKQLRDALDERQEELTASEEAHRKRMEAHREIDTAA